MNNQTQCLVMIWSTSAMNTVQPVLITFRWSSICLPHFVRIILCYYEAIFDNYLNLLQSYILFALNVCRYLQVTRNDNVYITKRNIIIIFHLLIYSLPLLFYIIAILSRQFILNISLDDTCDLFFTSISIQIIFLILWYFIPVILTLVFLILCLKYIRNIKGIQTEQIIAVRLKHHRQIVLQSVVFYPIWVVLWSPYLLLFPFYYRDSTLGTVTQILSYVSLGLDPIVIASLDVRFLRAWYSTWNRLMKYIKPTRVDPIQTIVLTACKHAQTKEHVDIPN